MFEWDDSLLVNNEMIDADHKYLFDLSNEVMTQLLRDGIPSEEVGATIVALVEFTESHFGREEDLMREHSYPDLESHTADHDQLKKDVVELKQRFDEGDRTAGIDLVSLLTRVMSSHIKVVDAKLAEFLRED